MRCLLCCLLGFSAFAGGVVANPPAGSSGWWRLREEQALPCYIVISNNIRNDNERREVTILVDKNDVNEGNFLRLHEHFSAIYADATDFSVRVKTSLNFTVGQYTTDGDVERVEAGQPRSPKAWEKDAQGIIMRVGDIEEFGYKDEGGDLSDLKYVLLRGIDPNCHRCKRIDRNNNYVESAKVALPRRTEDDVPCHYSIGNFVSDHQRSIGLFINPEDGNESNLLSLMRDFSRRYPKPDAMVIRLYTNHKQSYDFLAKTLGNYYVPAMAEHFAAVLFREGRNSVIRYRRPHEEVTTVVVEGVDKFPGLDEHQKAESFRRRTR